MPADYSRISRLLKIVTLVQSGGGWNAKKLAETTGANERSIFRDLDVLTAAGVPIEFDRSLKGYVIRREFFMPPVELKFNEALALIAMAEQVAGKKQVPHLRAAESAAQKLRSQLPVNMRDQLIKTDGKVAIKLAAAAEDETEGEFPKVHRAIETHTELDVAYESARNAEDTPFRLRPYSLLFNQRAWYVLGFSLKHNAVRSFKLSRFTRLVNTETPYEIPKTWTLEKHLGNAWRMIRGDRTHDVELHFTPQFSDTVEETRWHRTQKTETLPDGSLKFTCTIDGLDEIVWWVLSMGPSCKVIRPPELVMRIKQLASEVSALYK